MTTNRKHDAEFARLGPWVTGFVVDGEPYGGGFDATNDVRLAEFAAAFPTAATILELGSLEGGHSIMLAKRPGVTRVLAIEGREANIRRAELAKKLFNAGTVEFLQANLETEDLAKHGRFDAVYCVGLLYHLPEPWKLIAQIAKVSPALFLWTHFAPDARANETVHGYRGLTYSEYGMADPLSGMSATSFWPAWAELKRMLADHGFVRIEVVRDEPNHPHGPCVTLTATKS